MEVTSIPFIQQLRNSTAVQHTRLESLPVSKALLSEAVTLSDYALYLRCLYDVVSFYDSIVLPQIESLVPNTFLRYKTPAIANDIDGLKDHLFFLTKPLDVPTIPDQAFAMGMAYVIEGSTLGGRIIIKHLTPRLGVSEIHGATFFAGYGSETGMMWKQFLEAITHFAEEPGRASRVIEGAVAGFDMIYSHFLKNSTRNEN